MYWGRPVKIDTALYPISTQRNLAVAPDDISSVVYRGGSSHFFGIGIYPVSEWLGISIFGQYRSPLFRIVPPFFPQKGGCPHQKGGHCPPFEEKRGQLPPF